MGFIGSWVVIHRVISRVTMLITHMRGLIAPLITAHEPASNGVGFSGLGLRCFGCQYARLYAVEPDAIEQKGHMALSRDHTPTP